MYQYTVDTLLEKGGKLAVGTQFTRYGGGRPGNQWRRQRQGQHWMHMRVGSRSDNLISEYIRGSKQRGRGRTGTGRVLVETY